MSTPISMPRPFSEFRVFADPYYWRTALLIAQNALSRQYRNSYLGMVWTLILPLTQVVIYSFIMPLLMRFPADQYVVFLVCSLPLWNFIAGTMHNSSNALITQSETLKRCMVSSTVFPIADVLKSSYTYMVSFVVMYMFAMVFFSSFHVSALLMPLYFIPVLIIMLAMGIAIAFLAPYARDIGELIMVATNILLWLTPVVYPISVLPPAVQAVMQWNPFYIMIHPFQQLGYLQEIPSVFDTARLLALTALTCAVSYVIYRVCRRNYVYYL